VQARLDNLAAQWEMDLAPYYGKPPAHSVVTSELGGWLEALR